MEQQIFITGGTGMVGRELVSLLFKNTQAKISLLVHEKGSDNDKETVLQSFFLLPNKKEFTERLQIVRGDITKLNMGVESHSDYNELLNKTTHILHCAASTRFDLPLDEARRINVFGTKNVADFSLKCSNLRKFGFISTAYVSGKRIGVIKESELEHDAGFVNTYEQSKYEAEMFLKDLAKSVPVAVYRLSTVIGDSNTGKVSHFTAPHQAIRMMYLGLASMLPGTPDYSVDLISSDYTASTLFNLFWDNFSPNKTFHITHGSRSLTLQEIIDESFKGMAEADSSWIEKNYPKPAIVSEETFDLFMNSAVAANNPILKNVLTALNNFAHQLLYPKNFSKDDLLVVFPSYEKDLPEIHNYYGKVIEYCIKSKWGKIQ